jgi:two-component system chemotaxis response regulator CheB
MRNDGQAPMVVAIGGSAGSFEALQELLPQLPKGSRLAVVVVLHQHRHAGRQLAAQLAAYAQLPVLAVADKHPIEPGHIYVSPANYHLLVEPDRTFSLSTDAPVNFARPSIDVFFDSAARVYRHALVGVLLSGTSTDGAVGLAAITAHGGRAACQDPATALQPAMPRAGCAATTVDWVAAPQRIGAQLAELDS